VPPALSFTDRLKEAKPQVVGLNVAVDPEIVTVPFTTDETEYAGLVLE
jgi:hypothetical protein